MVLSNQSVDAYFNPAAFEGAWHHSERDGRSDSIVRQLAAQRAARGPGSENVDVSIFKNFNFTERHYLQFRAEFFNADQHADILPARGQQPDADLHRRGREARAMPAIHRSES